MKIAAIAIIGTLALAGCANLNNMTPEQRQAFFANMQANQNAYAARQQAILNNEQVQLNAAASNARANQGMNCATSYNGNQAFTHCQ